MPFSQTLRLHAKGTRNWAAQFNRMNGKKYDLMTVNLQSMKDLLKDCHNWFITSLLEIPMELLIFKILDLKFKSLRFKV